LARIPSGSHLFQADGTSNRFTQADPLTRLLIERLHLKIGPAAILVILIPTLPIYIVASLNHLWPTTQSGIELNAITGAVLPQRIGLLPDYGWWWYQFISWPATVLFFLWLPQGIQGAIDGLRKNGVLVLPQAKEGTDALAEFTSSFSDAYSHPVWAAASLVALVVLMSFIVPTRTGHVAWTTSSPVLFVYTQLVHSLILYLMFLFLVRSIVAVVWFDRLFRRFQVEVDTLNPDGAGGFFPFGNLVVKAGYLIGIYGCTVLVAIVEAPYLRGEGLGFQMKPEVAPFLILYILFAPALFFVAFNSSHLAMKNARNIHLSRIAERYRTRLVSMTASVRTCKPDELKGDADELMQVRKLHQMAADSPVWPVDTRHIARFCSGYLLPVILGISLLLAERWLLSK
jgi:hypothetical protein